MTQTQINERQWNNPALLTANEILFRINKTMTESGTIYEPKDVLYFLEGACIPVWDKKTEIRGDRRIVREVLNVPCAFDTETTSFCLFHDDLNDLEDLATMYAWMLGINGRVMLGRTWDEFINVCESIRSFYGLNETKQMFVFVHNLSFDCQFFRKYFEFSNVFAADSREPIYMSAKIGLSFRDSYILTNKSLANWANGFHTYVIRKKTGDLDYSLIRHSQTPLTDAEKGYCVYDVLVLMCGIMERINDENGKITKIPLTSTGYVRRSCRTACIPPKSRAAGEYIKFIHTLNMTVDEYRAAKAAFMGGYTHGNSWHVGKIGKHLFSKDFTSSYPAVMAAMQYPMGPGRIVTIDSREKLDKICSEFCCVFYATFYGIKSNCVADDYISTSKLVESDNVIRNNGRMNRADRAGIWITNVDFDIIKRTYTWEKMSVRSCRIYKRGYLPRVLILEMLKYYEGKTTLKGVKGEEVLYAWYKELVNAIYGMMVTDPCRDEIIYTDEWERDPVNLEEAIDRYNGSKSRFNFYLWGIFVTAYARRNLWSAIIELGNDYWYSDTDSVKYEHHYRHAAYFERYNRYITGCLERMCAALNIPVSMIRPKTVKGIEKPLGVWDPDGEYVFFKFLGAKRYATVKKDVLDGHYQLSITVAGLDKRSSVPYMCELAGIRYYQRPNGEVITVDRYNGKEDALKFLEVFDDGLFIPEGKTGKLTHIYGDYEFTCSLTDYLGNTMDVHELSFVHLKNSTYSLGMSEEFVNFLMGTRNYRISYH